jgi:hypothetical protein
MRLDQQIPVLLVERQALNEAMEGESKVSVSSGSGPPFFLFLQNVQPSETLTLTASAKSRAHATCLRLGAYVCPRSGL